MSRKNSNWRVLHLITRFLDGGAEKTTVQTLDALVEADLDYDLRLGFGAAHDSERVARLPEYVTPVEFRTIRHYNPFTPPLAVFHVARYLRTEGIDIIHTHSTEAGLIGRWAAAFARTPAVVHEIHGDPVAKDRNPLLNAAVETLERTAAGLADRLVVNSERIRNDFLDRGIGRSDQYRLIYDGVDINAYARGAEETLRTRGGEPPPADDRTILMYVGRIVDGKGLFDLLEVFDRLSGEYDIELRIAGDGPLLNDLQAEIEWRGLDAVTLCGYVDDVAGQLAGADIFVLPSYREGTPRVITEALAAGVPVVSTTIAGIPEQVDDGETGLLVEPGDRDALEAALRRLIENPNVRDRMGAKAMRTLEKFDLETANRAYRDLYAELVRSIGG